MMFEKMDRLAQASTDTNDVMFSYYDIMRVKAKN